MNQNEEKEDRKIIVSVVLIMFISFTIMISMAIITNYKYKMELCSHKTEVQNNVE